MFEEFMGLEKDNNYMSKKSAPAYESAWLGRWMGSDATPPGQSRLSHKEEPKCVKESSVVGPEISVGDFAVGEQFRDVLECERLDTKENLEENHGGKHGEEVLDVSPFPMFNLSQQSESIAATTIEHNTLGNRFQGYQKVEATSSFHEGEGSSTQALAIRRPLTPSWMHSHQENPLPAPCFENEGKLSSNHYPSNPVQVKTTRNMLDLIRPMRIYAAVDSGEGASGEPYSFSQTTRHFLLTEKTDLNLSKGGQVFRESTVSMKLKGKMFSGFLDLFPNLDLCHRGVRLQSLGSSKDSEEGPRKNDEVKSSAACARNESSAETDTFNMDNFQRIRLSGSTSTFSLKDQRRKNQSAVPRVEIPDMNQEPPAVPDGENSVDGHGGEASTSETQSMNVEHFLSNAELQKDCKRVLSDPEPCSSTWVKRLKTSASDSSGRITKNMKIEEASPGEKVNDFFHRIIKCGVTSPEPRNEEPSTSHIMNTKLGGKDITLLHPWIQRWCKNKAMTSHQSTGQEIICKPETSKDTSLEEIQKKQFPSIAAMALMGKALSGLSPSGLRKSGSLMIWNTPDLR